MGNSTWGGGYSFLRNLWDCGPDRPIKKQMGDEEKKGIGRCRAEQMTEGWVGGLVREAVLKGGGWPADAAKIRAAMENVKVDTQGLRGGPIEWSKENHFRTRQYYRVY